MIWILDSQGSTSSALSNETRPHIPHGIPEQHGAYLSSTFHHYIGRTHQQLDTASSSHATVLRDAATASGAYGALDMHQEELH